MNEIDPFLIKIWPNPASEKLYISFENFEMNNIQIINSLGQVIMNIKDQVQNIGFQNLNISGLDKGVYIIKGTNKDKQRFWKTFIKL